MQEIRVWTLGKEDPLEKEMVTHSSILAWEIPSTEELGGLQPMGSQSQIQLSVWNLHFTFVFLCNVIFYTSLHDSLIPSEGERKCSDGGPGIAGHAYLCPSFFLSWVWLSEDNKSFSLHSVRGLHEPD